jgi:hypothetical protein
MIQQDNKVEVLSPLNKRTKGKHCTDYTLADSYKLYCEKYDTFVDYSIYRRICVEFNENQIMQNTVLKGGEFYLPVKLGTIGVRKKVARPFFSKDGEFQVNHLPVDYKATRALWAKDPEARINKKVIRNLNEHSNRYRYRFYWDKRTCTVPNQSAYVFLATRTHSRELAAIINSNCGIDFCLETKN